MVWIFSLKKCAFVDTQRCRDDAKKKNFGKQFGNLKIETRRNFPIIKVDKSEKIKNDIIKAKVWKEYVLGVNKEVKF